MTLVDAIRAGMSDCGLTQYALSQASGVPQSRLSEILNGVTLNPTWQTIAALLRALGKDYGWLHRKGVRP